MSKLSLLEIKDRFIATLLNGTIGDALGNPVEGLSPELIKSRHGRIEDYEENWDQRGVYTDDTELKLCVADSLVSVGAFSLEDIANRFVRWLPTANSFGLTFQNAIVNLYNGANTENSGVPSQSNGTASIIAPLGLFYSHPDDLELLLSTTRRLTMMTHSDEKAFAGALAVSYSIHYLLNLESRLEPTTLLEDLQSRILPIDKEFAERMDFVKRNLSENADFMAKNIGTSGHVIQSIPFAFYCFLHTPNDYKTSVLNAVNAGGDTDTNASITGNLSGCYNGTASIPREWIYELRNSDKIISTAKKLFGVYFFNLPDYENRRRLIYDNERKLGFALKKEDFDNAARLYAELGASYSLMGEHERGLLYVSQGLSILSLPLNRFISLKLLKGKVLADSGQKDLALAELLSIESPNPHHILLRNILAVEISLG